LPCFLVSNIGGLSHLTLAGGLRPKEANGASGRDPECITQQVPTRLGVQSGLPRGPQNQGVVAVLCPGIPGPGVGRSGRVLHGGGPEFITHQVPVDWGYSRGLPRGPQEPKGCRGVPRGRLTAHAAGAQRGGNPCRSGSEPCPVRLCLPTCSGSGFVSLTRSTRACFGFTVNRRGQGLGLRGLPPRKLRPPISWELVKC
jgi:hypothetical protein